MIIGAALPSATGSTTDGEESEETEERDEAEEVEETEEEDSVRADGCAEEVCLEVGFDSLWGGGED